MYYNNVFYQSYFNIIGGVETFLYELARLADANGRDLTIVYGTGHPSQIKRLKQYCRVYQLDEIEKPIKCKRAFFNYNIGPIDDFEAEEYIQIVHADFSSDILQSWIEGIKNEYQHDKITKKYAVSKNNAIKFKEVVGEDVEVLYNPIIIDDEPRIMTLVSAQRLSPEKGGERIEQLAKSLDERNISYIWHIFSNDRLSYQSPNIIYHQVTLDVRKWLKYADYTVLLSDTEGFPYTAYESLCLGTPLIITDLPMLPDLGTNESNSIVLNFDMSNLDVDEIYQRAGKFKFKYTPKSCDPWLELLEGESLYKYEKPVPTKVRAIMTYYDLDLQRWVEYDEVITTMSDRAKFLADKGAVAYVTSEVKNDNN